MKSHTFACAVAGGVATGVGVGVGVGVAVGAGAGVEEPESPPHAARNSGNAAAQRYENFMEPPA
ncbi:hypothetical protein PMI02_01897 [Novosphingobium sp. AP12]|nr:hypothetical protein PMI02_01897 [Novosphingobium sp. AP12]